jgi:hypothetical protein
MTASIALRAFPKPATGLRIPAAPGRRRQKGHSVVGQARESTCAEALAAAWKTARNKGLLG